MDASTKDLDKDTEKNPMGLDGFELVEFAAPECGILESVFTMMGCVYIANHRSKDVVLFGQGDINFIINYESSSYVHYFAKEHGPSACGMAFRVKNAQAAYRKALEMGPQPVDIPTGPMQLRLPAIKDIGGAPLYLIDRYGDGDSIYDIDFEFIDNTELHPRGCGLNMIDHLTYHVYRGRMDHWASFYEDIFNFREIRYFDITGEYTGLKLKAMSAPDGKIRISLNEEATAGGQIEEFLMAYNGKGIQHVAFSCDDILATWDQLKAQGLPPL